MVFKKMITAVDTHAGEPPEFKNVTISQISGPPTHPEAHLKNAVTVATGPLDWGKSETWTGGS